MRQSRGWQLARHSVLTIGLLLEFALLTTCSPPTPLLQQRETLGYIRIGTINSPTTYYQSGEGPTGFEYDLAHRFADALDLELDLQVLPSATAVLEALASGRIDVAAANLSISDARSSKVMFSPAVREVVPQLVYRRGTRRPEQLSVLAAPVVLPDKSVHREWLTGDEPGVSIATRADVSHEDLLGDVAVGKIAHSVADSDIIAMSRRYFPDLAVAFDVGQPVSKAWAFGRHADTSLFNAAVKFLTELRLSGELARLHDRYFGHVDRLDFVSSRTLSEHMAERLPALRPWFESAGETMGLDWRLLAAISYQESHWDPKARSPTGVRGLMMLTRDTADFVGVKNRIDPQQSIDGGARYFRFLLDRLPDSIQPPDRVWLALAAYNLGYGHVLDLRELTQRQGGDPDRWVDLRARLRLLTQQHWYAQTRYGYARGLEAQVYVGNVRTYLDVLRWMTRFEDPPGKRSSDANLAQPSPPQRVVPPASPLDIELPVL